MRARCDCSAAAATQGLRGKPCTSHLEDISNKIKVSLPFSFPFRRDAHQLEAAGFCPRTVCWCTHDTPIYSNLRHRTLKRDPAACDPTSNCLQWNKQLRNLLSGVGRAWRGVRGLTASNWHLDSRPEKPSKTFGLSIWIFREPHVIDCSRASNDIRLLADNSGLTEKCTLLKTKKLPRDLPWSATHTTQHNTTQCNTSFHPAHLLCMTSCCHCFS